MQPYENYKDSTIEWIGEIPENWNVKKIKYISKLQGGFAFKSDDFTEIGLPIIRIGDIKDKIVWDACKKIPDTLKIPEEFLLKINDTLIALSGATTGKSCFLSEEPIKSFINQRVAKVSFDNKLLYFNISSDFVQKLIFLTADGSAQENISNAQIENIVVAFPNLKDEQTAIANYLDRKTAELDNLIAKKEKLLALYEEEKTAIINRAVTRGIPPLKGDKGGCPDTPMKDSGIEWLGVIPEHWEVKRLRYIGNCQNGISQGADYFGFGFPFVSYGNVYKNIVLPEKVEGLANSTESDKINYSVKKGDVLFTRTSETIEEIGIASTCFKTIDNAVFAGFLIRFRPFEEKLFEGFSKYYFRAQIHRRFFVKEMNLVTRASLSQELLKKLPIVLPSLTEQKQIANYLDKQILGINSKIEKTKKIIELQKEFRTALISEAVTGKIKVTEI